MRILTRHRLLNGNTTIGNVDVGGQRRVYYSNTTLRCLCWQPAYLEYKNSDIPTSLLSLQSKQPKHLYTAHQYSPQATNRGHTIPNLPKPTHDPNHGLGNLPTPRSLRRERVCPSPLRFTPIPLISLRKYAATHVPAQPFGSLATANEGKGYTVVSASLRPKAGVSSSFISEISLLRVRCSLLLRSTLVPGGFL